MLTHILFPWLSGFHLDRITTNDQTIHLELTATQPEATCPLCRQPSHAVHSHYDRTIADLPWVESPVRILAQVRKFFCHNPTCPRMIFTERIAHLAAPSARRTQRLGAEQQQLALEYGGEAAARTAARQAT